MKANARVQLIVKETRSETTQASARMGTWDHYRQGQAGHRRCKLCTVVEFTSGLKGHHGMHNQHIGAGDSAHNFSLKLSPRVCVALVASLIGEMAGICQHVAMIICVSGDICTAFLHEVLLTMLITADSDKSCYY